MDCMPGLACFATDTAGVGVCGRVCCPGDATGCVGDLFCAGSGILIDATQTSWGRCLPSRSCDVLDPQAVCEEREGCYVIDTQGNTECRVAGLGGAGDPCYEQQDCQSGFFCGGIGALRQCVRICAIGGIDCPIDEGVCVAQAHSPAGSGFCVLTTGFR
jgi:hypothetical protein